MTAVDELRKLREGREKSKKQQEEADKIRAELPVLKEGKTTVLMIRRRRSEQRHPNAV